MKILVIVPHSDDEINLIGPIIDQLHDNHIEIHLAFVTNSDFVSRNTNRRYKESRCVTEFLGISYVYHLGYPDCFIGNHIYNSKYNNPVCSTGGHFCTYGIEEDEYHFIRFGNHALYCKRNVEDDIKDLILYVYADLIICVDVDTHPDHRMVSIIFDNVMGQIIKSTSYRPQIFKRFAYLGVWKGSDDYYERPMIETKYFMDSDSFGKFEFPYEWDDRIALPVNKECYQLKFWKSPIYRALSMYKSQNCDSYYFRISNSDAIFWQRSTDNIALFASVFCSSNNSRKDYINDFSIYSMKNVMDYSDDDYKLYMWYPDEEDDDKSVRLVFHNPVDIEEIVFYLPLKKIGTIKRIRLKIDNLYDKEKDLLDRSVQRITITKQNNIREIIITILDYEGVPGFREIEVYSKVQSNAWPIKRCETQQYDETIEKKAFIFRKIHDFLIIKENAINKLRNIGNRLI